MAWSLRQNRVFAGMLIQVVYERSIGCWCGKRVPIAERRQFLRKMRSMAIENRPAIPLDLDMAGAFMILQNDCEPL